MKMLARLSIALLAGLLAIGAEASETPETELPISDMPSGAELLHMAEFDQPVELVSSKGQNMETCPDDKTKCLVGEQCDSSAQVKLEPSEQAAEQPAPWIEPRNQLDLFRFIGNGFKSHYENQYDTINKYLVEKLPDSLNVAQNLHEADLLLEAERERGIWRNRALIEALEQLLQLTTLQSDEVRCSRQAYAILWKNNQAVKGLAQRPKDEMQLARRIETLIHRASKFHSVACFNYYPQKFLELRKLIDPMKLRLVETFMDNYLENVSCIKLSSKTVSGQKAVRVAYQLIDDFSHHDVNRKYLYKTINEVSGRLEVSSEGVSKLVERYIVEPCRAFVWHFGPDVFVPARFGTRVLDQEDRYDNEHMQFLHSWLHYRLCETLVRHDKVKRRLVKDLVHGIMNQKYPVHSSRHIQS